MKAIIISIITYLIILSPFVIYPHPSLAQSLSEADQKLQEIQSKIRELQNQVDKAKSEQKSLKSQLTSIDAQTQITQLKIEETNTLLAKLEMEITQLTTKINQLSLTVDNLTQLLLNRIVQTYKYGNYSTVELFFSSKGFHDALNRIKYMQTAQINDKKMIYQLQATKAAFNDQRTEKETLQKKQEKLKQDLVVFQAQLAEQKKAKQELLVATQNDEKRYQSLIAQLQAEADSVRRALSGAGVKVGPVKRGDAIAVVGMTGCTTGPHLHLEVMTNARVENNTLIGRENKVDPKSYLDSGQFEKPIGSYTGSVCGNTCHNGDISALFGASGADYIKGFPPHTGLDIVEKQGTPIRAVDDGIAYAFSDSRTCYLTGTAGKGIAVDHQNGTVTLYWHIP